MFVGLCHRNRPDLLARAISTIPELLPIRIQNNAGIPLDLPAREDISVSEVRDLTFSRSVNELHCRALTLGNPFWFIMHPDATATPEDFARLIEMATEATEAGRKWFTIFTHHDVLACYNTTAFEAVGRYNTAFANYFVDNDFYRRGRLAGYEMLQLENHGVQHGVEGVGSQTINSDPTLKIENDIMFPAYRALYAAMWGSPDPADPVGHETFATPWNR